MNKKSQILKLAENKVRSGGYGNFSFRELADEIGIKSSSVHYYFRTKADLGAALAHQYVDEFLALLNAEKAKLKGRSAINLYINAFKTALEKDNQMCLCGLLGAQSDALPEQVNIEIKRFFELNINWLQTVYIDEKGLAVDIAKTKAIQLLATLEGMMILAKVLDDTTAFDSLNNYINEGI
ncbi:TetR/AcrR family transcriptional regulator [Colwellia sp. BRX10-4]|jgi:TetR/AcrR family transcriptional repressor of nem operon|uniref:TetR/AcrR family transcriptional regulator n=1 Tax=Colwellia sp. BRX10-4 TaxID=2759843 RepID=UPI0015F75424|nr:TetR/AcrR family transcriptional regulator [Colwellia sp. BRX10-4]MBA6397830.1 TetR/AcrR family transcriptional regulator [Colwellia sp. BRX10-4]